MIADDHAIVRKGLVQLLREEFPYGQVTEVSNGADAIEEVRKKKSLIGSSWQDKVNHRKKYFE